MRADDAGSSLASNIGCLTACLNGIATSIEVMMPCGWVEHMARILKPYPDIDVGIHLTLTSEWDNIKWRPLTHARSLIGEDGYFPPLLFPRPGDTRPNLQESDWVIDDIARELRTQIEYGLARFPNASHVSSHMARNFWDFDPKVGELVDDLCLELGLIIDPMGEQLPRVRGYPKSPRNTNIRIQSFVDELAALTGGTFIFVDHPAERSQELSALSHVGYEDVDEDRNSCLGVLTNDLVKEAVRKYDITLIDYRQL